VSLVGLDFNAGDLATALAADGFQIDEPAVFVWEAVTQYLTEDGVRGTLQFLAKAAAGSRLIFTFVRRDFVDGVNLYDAEPIYRDYKLKYDVLHFGLEPEHVNDLLGEYGWVEREQVGTSELVASYVAPTGRDIPVSQIERCVYAEKT
jgi:methyltransferase (TIGR00027 family)